MLGRATGAVLHGIDARLVEVEVDLAGGLPTIAAVGLPDSAVREGIDRIRSALRHSGFALPNRRIVVNLAPAEVPKHGAGLDLPIAVALLRAAGSLTGLETGAMAIVGELGLDGSLRPVRGALAVALAARAAGRRAVLLPRSNADEAALVSGLDVVAVTSLADVAAVAQGRCAVRPPLDARLQLEQAHRRVRGPDMSEVRGQASARRALEVAAAGGHHLLFHGPPGAGKSMLARRLPGILPPLSLEEALTVTRIHGAAGLTRGLVGSRPFRAPHHGISQAGLTGGGSTLRPGEISLATHGVLFLDELTEFRRDALEALRQPLEDGRITIVRARGTATFPADFSLVASMNPCPCGHHGSPEGRCSCTPGVLRRYAARISGPLLDRFDLVVPVSAVELEALSSPKPSEPSARVRDRVVAARERQWARFGAAGPGSNARMGAAELRRFVRLEGSARALLLAAADRLRLSARGFDRVRRVARTLADLGCREEVGTQHIAEAVQYRHPEPESDRLGGGLPR